MGKSITGVRNKDKDGDTRVIFKKINATMISRSRTISGASQVYSRSGILQIRNNLKNHCNYYMDRGKMKRDLSIETDVCILRRYYRTKRNRLSYQGSSVKSRYSTVVDTEVDTIEEFPDLSASGDNDTNEHKSNPPLDIATLMVDNLKDLLNQWIQKHFLENKDTKQKIDTVLDSLIQKLDGRKTSSSDSTYVLNKDATSQEVKNKKVSTTSISCGYCKHKARNVKVGSSSNSQKDSSSITIPFQYRDIRIISTLSIPRSFHKRGLDEKENQSNSWYKMKKIKPKNIILSINRSTKLLNSSSFDLVTISTKSLTKRCPNSDIKKKKKKRHIVFFPKPFYKSATDTSSTTNSENIKLRSGEINRKQLDAMPSLLKNFYANDPVIIANLDKNIQYSTKNDIFTMTENKSTELINNRSKATLDKPKDIYMQEKNENFLHEGDQNNPNKKSETLDITKDERIKINNGYKRSSNRGKINKRKRHPAKRITSNFNATTFDRIQNKQFTFLYKKATSPISQGKDFLKYFQNTLQYFEDYDGNKNIKLDVRINVFPMYDSGTKDACTDVSNQALSIYNLKPILRYNIQKTGIEAPVKDNQESIKDLTENDNSSCEFTPDIIPLFDSAVSQTKYIFNVTSRDKIDLFSKPNSVIERSTLTSELEIVHEISELRAVIKDLAAAAEKFVSEQLKRESEKSNAETNIPCDVSNNFTSSSKCEAVENSCKAVQYSKDFLEQQKLLSDLKFTKEPRKRETFDYYNRLAKKSTSYRIIDSESILKVTDMTSKANVNEYRFIDQALTCSLPKSRSLFEMTSEQRNKRKLIALFCDAYQKNLNSLSRDPISVNCSSVNFKRWYNWRKKKVIKKESKPLAPRSSTKRQSCTCRSSSRSFDSGIIPMMHCAPDFTYCSSLSLPQEQEAYDEQDGKLSTYCKERKGMGFGEGCVYCMLIWVPVLIIASLFYAYILKDKVVKFPDSKKVIGREEPEIQSLGNSSILLLKLSDLGF